MTFEEINDMILSKISWGFDHDEVITSAVDEAGKCIGNGSIVSILLLDGDGLLRNGYSPHLPPDYLQAIDGIKPDPQLGTCAAAAATGEVVITPDFCADSKWAELKHLPLSIGYKGAWSIPMTSADSRVIGTFGVYMTTERIPTEAEIAGTRLLASTIAGAICQKRQQLDASCS